MKKLSVNELNEAMGGTDKCLKTNINRTLVKDALGIKEALVTQDLKILISPKTLDEKNTIDEKN